MSALDATGRDPASDRDTDDIDLRAIWTVIVAGKYWLVGSVVLFTTLFVVAAFVMTPIYRSSVVLTPAGNRGQNVLSQSIGQFGGLASLAGINMGTEFAETEEALAVLRSREFTERFIQDRGLLPLLYADRFDADKKQWKVAPEKVPTLASAYRRFNKSIRSVAQDKKTGLITLHIEWRDREAAAKWANDLVDMLNAEMSARAIQDSDAAMGFLAKELESSNNVTIRDAIGRLIEMQVKQRMLANVTKEYSFRVVDRALPAEEADFVKPQRMRLFLAGPVVGAFVGLLALLFTAGMRRKS